ncbi:MAG: inner membrane CreD family protein, partial [Pseudomonadota bacterium]|nr:inner membrane CreD family protein [Pseudomonadota bacterium]
MRLGLKVLLVLAMTLAILVPLTMIRGVIHDRQAYRLEAVNRITRSFAGPQAFAGPVLVVPYTQTIEVEETTAQGGVVKRLREQAGQWTFFPTRLEIAGHLAPGTRQLGLHEVRVYEWRASAVAAFAATLPPPTTNLPRTIGRPWLSYAVADVRGLVGA